MSSVEKLEQMFDSALREAWQRNARLVQPDLQIHQNGLEDGTEAEEAGVGGEADVVVQQEENIATTLLLKLQLTGQNYMEGRVDRSLQVHNHISSIWKGGHS